MNSGGVVSDARTELDTQRLAKYIGGKHALVAQGGGQRGIFTSGVLDAFLLSNFDPYHEFYGTSAGALNLCAFLSRQAGLGKSFILELTTRSEFFHLFSYIRRKQYMNMQWALDRICEYPYRLDLGMARQVLGKRKAYAAVTSADDLKDAYFPMLGADWQQVLLATCAIPGLYPEPVALNGKHYIDGGVSASIPVQEAWRKEARFITVIRTEHTPPQVNLSLPPETEQPHWLPESLNHLQQQWQHKWLGWRQDWSDFFQQQKLRAREQKKEQKHLDALNGGRWLFGADDIYRLSHLLGSKFDAGLADLLMVHYQTYTLTSEFLEASHDDTFIVQIMPSEPLRSNSLLSSSEDLEHDYEVGLKAGYRFLKAYNEANDLRKRIAQYDNLSQHGLEKKVPKPPSLSDS
ncbi:patatin family protein [Vibrio mimicus]|uniref:patatin-like phospholipase family protein n=1 Tax=Vibrio mimicus TaxID=674 RepID=UPI0011D65BEC|nr:patatin-like phospholipase family protein [Vibrio mimicus]TXY29370.1 patatin family protein [Vibrio mimicus]